MKELLFLILSFFTLPLIGQNCCTGGSPLANNINLTNVDSGLVVQIVYDHNLMNDFVSRSEILDDDTYTRYNSSYFLQVSWAINKRLAFGLMINHSTHYLKREVVNFNRETRSSGLGDLLLTVNYNIWSQGKHNLQLGSGILFPTGKKDVVDDNFNILLPWDLQPGYGGWGALLLSQYQNGRILMDNLTYFNLLIYQHLFKNQKPETSQYYQQGSEVQFYQGLGYNIFLNQILLSPQAGLRFKFTNQDQINDATVESSGGMWLYNMLGLNVKLPKNLTVMMAYESPVFRQLNGSQLTTSSRFRLGLSVYLGAQTESRSKTINF